MTGAGAGAGAGSNRHVFATLVGSSNLGYRSVLRDTELSFLVMLPRAGAAVTGVTEGRPAGVDRVQAKLGQELSEIQRYCVAQPPPLLDGREEGQENRSMPLWLRAATQVTKYFL